MTNIVNIVPFLAIVILLINPILLLIYRRWEINTHKLRFWFMATSALSWILLSLSSFLGFETEINLGWNTNIPLLAIPVVVFDWISISLALSLGALVFYATVCQIFSPQQSAWISGLGAICILGTFAGSVFTILFVWTLIEIFWITYSALYQSRDRGLILPVLFRLLVPLILIYASMIGKGEGIGDSFSTYTTTAGPILITAGALGFGTWLPFRRRETKGDPGGNAEFLARIFPAAISLMLVCRGALLIDNNDLSPSIPILLSILTLVLGLMSLITRPKGFSHRIWSLGILALIIGSALIGSPAGSLGWGLVFILTVSFIFMDLQDEFRSLPALIFAAIGILPLPYFPAWIGRDLFNSGITGVFYGIGAGLILGGVLWEGVKSAVKATQSEEKTLIFYRFSPAIKLITQIIIVLPLLIVNSEKGIFSSPITVWIPIPLMFMTVFFRGRAVEKGFIQIKADVGRSLDFVPSLFSTLGSFGDRIVSFISDLFEGEGGLIWALLIGFLIITIITLSGGS